MATEFSKMKGAFLLSTGTIVNSSNISYNNEGWTFNINISSIRSYSLREKL